ncbi:MAG: hypothetical protein U0797_30365 [Gemmataceae bacterium]
MPASAARSARRVARRPHERSASWLSHVGFALGTLRITQDGKADVYSVSPIPSDYGLAVRFERFGAGEGEESYEVLVEGGKATCSCKAGTYLGYCKHGDCALALHRTGNL